MCHEEARKNSEDLIWSMLEYAIKGWRVQQVVLQYGANDWFHKASTDGHHAPFTNIYQRWNRNLYISGDCRAICAMLLLLPFTTKNYFRDAM